MFKHLCLKIQLKKTHGQDALNSADMIDILTILQIKYKCSFVKVDGYLRFGRYINQI